LHYKLQNYKIVLLEQITKVYIVPNVNLHWSIKLDKKKAIGILIVFILIGCILSYFSQRTKKINNANRIKTGTTHNSSATNNISAKRVDLPPPREKEKFAQLKNNALSFCPQLANEINEDEKDENIQAVEEFGHNLHFKKNGEIYRIRIFTEDSAEGSYQKLVYFKEDSDGFPEIIPIQEEESINPSQKQINSYLDSAQIIYESQDLNIQLTSGKAFSVTLENGTITRVNSNTVNCD